MQGRIKDLGRMFVMDLRMKVPSGSTGKVLIGVLGTKSSRS